MKEFVLVFIRFLISYWLLDMDTHTTYTASVAAQIAPTKSINAMQRNPALHPPSGQALQDPQANQFDLWTAISNTSASPIG